MGVRGFLTHGGVLAHKNRRGRSKGARTENRDAEGCDEAKHYEQHSSCPVALEALSFKMKDWSATMYVNLSISKDAYSALHSLFLKMILNICLSRSRNTLECGFIPGRHLILLIDAKTK